MNRPDKLNAINDAMFAALLRIAEHLAADRSVRAVVLTARGGILRRARPKQLRSFLHEGHRGIVPSPSQVIPGRRGPGHQSGARQSSSVATGDRVGQGFAASRKGGTLAVTSVSNVASVGLSVSPFELAMFQKRIQGVLYGRSPRAWTCPGSSRCTRRAS